MKIKITFFWVLLLFSFLLSVGNILSGLALAEHSSQLAQWHLIRAIFMVALGIISSAALIFLTQKRQDQILKSILLRDPKARLTPPKEMKIAHAASFGLILLLLMGLLSGSTATAGRFPFLHSMFGFAVVALFMGNLFLWAVVNWKISKQQVPPRESHQEAG